MNVGTTAGCGDKRLCSDNKISIDNILGVNLEYYAMVQVIKTYK